MATNMQDFYPSNSIGRSKQLLGVFEPKTIEDVQYYVEWAIKEKKQLYPVSGGRNWGYGSKSPVEDGSYLLDLSNLNKICEVDQKGHTVTLEAGVTQQQLYDYFQKNNLDYLVPTNGAGPNSTIVGNMCERGYGITPPEDRFQSLLCCTVILPDGKIWKPLLSEMGLEHLDKLFKWGVGPYLEGIFTQSNLGIVVEATLSIKPRPEFIECFVFQIDDENLEIVTETIAHLKSELGSILGGVNLMNGRRMLSMSSENRKNLGWEKAGAMDKEFLSTALKDYGLCAWSGLGTLYGPKSVVRTVKSFIKKALNKHCKRILFLSPQKTKCLRSVFSYIPGGLARNIEGVLERLEEGQKILMGTPQQTALRLAYWQGCLKPADENDLDPARDKCGLIWYSPLVPTRAKYARDYVEMVERVCLKYSIEPLITLTFFDHRVADSTVPILFDQSSEAQTKAAHDCYLELLEEGHKIGVFPYRFPISNMGEIYERAANGNYWSLVKKIKETMDKDALLSRGRYCPSSKSV